ncbi:MAG: hypothetical protein HY689_04120 [Chloroflexi bacterium]|nr:hypothetical protein [Chloroflexota bacterium]
MRRHSDARPPASLAAAGGRAGGKGLESTHGEYTPVALQVAKRGRIICPAKLTSFLGSNAPVLMTVHRHQIGVEQVVSLPNVVVDYAEQHGATRYYFVRERDRLMVSIALAEVRRSGWQQRNEYYIPIEAMAPAPWRAWRYATEAVVLEHTPPPPGPPRPATHARQLTLAL